MSTEVARIHESLDELTTADLVVISEDSLEDDLVELSRAQERVQADGSAGTGSSTVAERGIDKGIPRPLPGRQIDAERPA